MPRIPQPASTLDQFARMAHRDLKAAANCVTEGYNLVAITLALEAISLLTAIPAEGGETFKVWPEEESDGIGSAPSRKWTAASARELNQIVNEALAELNTGWLAVKAAREQVE